MNKNYIIWGISDKGYEDSISSSYPNNVIPAEFKVSVSDNHRQYAFAFARENPYGYYFYSIEQVGSNVLYTIFRTNFKGGSTRNRLAYDAATIIISKNHIIEKPLDSLKLLISSYIKQKDSGFGNFNFENVLAGIRLLVNNDKRSISKRYKAGYIKYHSETELSSALVDKKDKLHNFNKVYFFTRLSLLEQGENKIQDLNDYKATPIKIINYDVRYYSVFVENNEVTPFGNTFNAYKGEEIKIYKAKVNTLQNVEIATAGLTITLKKIEPPKPKPQLTGQDISRKRKSKEKITKYVVLALCSVMIVVISGFMLEDNIKVWLRYRSSNPPPPKTVPQATDSIEDHKVVFDGEYFTKLEPECSKRDTITNADSLFTYFKESIYFKDDTASYTLYIENDDWKIFNDKVERLMVDDLKKLIAEIEKANQLADTKKIVDHINKVIQYNKLKYEEGLEYDKKIFKINAPYFEFRESDSNTEGFTKYKIEIKGELKTFLKKNLPKNIFDGIIKIQTEFKKNKTNKKTDTRKTDKQVYKTECKLTEKHKENKFWLQTLNKLNKWHSQDEYKDRLSNLVKQGSDAISLYENCRCTKCQTILKDKNLIKVKEFF